jgi:hypothetical protein
MLDPRTRRDKHRAALGQTIAAYPVFRALKVEAQARLASGESEDTVLAWLAERSQEELSETEALLATGWFADWLLQWAKTGEPGPLWEGSVGDVMVHRSEIDGQPVTMVVVMATALSDARGLAEEFVLACDRTFPHVSRRRFRDPEQAARWFRLHREGVGWAELARRKVREDRPDLGEKSEGFRELVKIERETIKRSATRWWEEYGYKIAEVLYPGSE